MTPLGQQIARLLQPERWTEWELTGERRVDIQHDGTGLRLGFCTEPWPGTGDLRVELDQEHMEPGFGHWEKRRLVKATARIYWRLQRHSRECANERAGQQIGERLMTAEERAIEELLRS